MMAATIVKASTLDCTFTTSFTPPKMANNPKTAPGLVMVKKKVCGMSQA